MKKKKRHLKNVTSHTLPQINLIILGEKNESITLFISKRNAGSICFPSHSRDNFKYHEKKGNKQISGFGLQNDGEISFHATGHENVSVL